MMDPLKPTGTWDSGFSEATAAEETRRHRHYRSSGVFNVFSAPAPVIVEPEKGNGRTPDDDRLSYYDSNRQYASPSPQLNEDDDVNVYSYRPPLEVDLDGPRHIALRQIKDGFSQPPSHARGVASYRGLQYQTQMPPHPDMHQQQEGSAPAAVPIPNNSVSLAPHPVLSDVAVQRPILRHRRGHHQLVTHPIDIDNIMQEQQQQPEPSRQASLEFDEQPASIAASVNTNIASPSQAQAIPLRDVDKRMIFACPLRPNKWFHIKFTCNAGIQGEVHRPFDYDLYHACLVPNAAVIHLGRPCTCIRADTPLPETTSMKTSSSARSKIDMSAESTVIKGQTKAEVSTKSGDAFLSTMMGGIELEPKKKKEKKVKPKESAKRPGSFLSKLIR